MKAGEQKLRHIFGFVTHDRDAIADVTGSADETIAEAERQLTDMLPHLGYLDEPDHPMASSLFSCASMLALYLAMKQHEMDVHTFGRKILEQTAQLPQEPAAESMPPVLEATGVRSAQDQKPGEFVFETVPGDGESFDWGMNIKSCAICGLFSRYEAMDLVPYMCASDDVVSDSAGQGLMRTGTIALGAHHCDFRFRKGGDGHALVDQYPEKIRLVD